MDCAADKATYPKVVKHDPKKAAKSNLNGPTHVRKTMVIVSPKRVVGCKGGNQNVEGDLLTFG